MRRCSFGAFRTNMEFLAGNSSGIQIHLHCMFAGGSHEKRICISSSAYISAFAQTSRVIPQGTEIKVRTDSAIPAKPAAGSAYSATVSQDVQDSSGAVVITHGSPARLVAVKNGNDTTLDLRSVTIDGRRYSITSAEGKSSSGGL